MGAGRRAVLLAGHLYRDVVAPIELSNRTVRLQLYRATPRAWPVTREWNGAPNDESPRRQFRLFVAVTCRGARRVQRADAEGGLW
jgi:hypothetical protein